MGYRTKFRGSLAISPPLSADHQAYLEAFNQTRHMARDWSHLTDLDDPLRQAVGLPLGYEGAYYVGDANQGAPYEGALSTQHPPGSVRVGWIINPMPLTPAQIGRLVEDGKGWFTSHGYTKSGEQCPRRHNHAESESCTKGFTSLGLGFAYIQPGLWCQWVPENAVTLMWDGEPEFYQPVEWLRYLIENFFEPWGYTLDGKVSYQGEDPDDVGQIIVERNVVAVAKPRKEDE